MITKDELLKCQKLLHKHYQDVPIVIYRSRLLFTTNKFLEGVSFNRIQEHLLKQSRGWYDPINNKVHITLFSFVESEFAPIEVVLLLFHELRHHYQTTRKPRLFKQRNWELCVTDSRYNSDPTERDANKFAARMCNKYKSEISEILKIEADWVVNGYS